MLTPRHNQQILTVIFSFWGRHVLLPVGVLLASPDPTSPPGGDEPDLLTRAGAPLDGGGLADMLVVTTSVGMFHGVHRHTTHLEEAGVRDRITNIIQK